MSQLRSRAHYEKEESERLAPAAVKSIETHGRVFAEPDHAYRTAFQRDRDRIVHSQAFRRLEYKTQVFVHHVDDHYRNRLTHTLEGAQIARTIVRALRLNEELAEAVALAHDLGHTPFGHAGERVLAELMREHGGFDHNRQSLRVVDWLEERYPEFRGLNLTAESREGILKHGAGWDHPVALPELSPQRSLEAQVADVSDEIAYINHDLEDGLRSGLLRWENLAEIRLWSEAARRARDRCGASGAPLRVVRSQAIIALINGLVTDLIERTAGRLAEAAPDSVSAVRRAERPLVGFAPATATAVLELKRFLLENLYHHPTVLDTTRKAERVVEELFRAFRADSSLLPRAVRGRFAEDGEARAVADYVAGMTDRFAMAERQKLLDPHGPT